MATTTNFGWETPDDTDLVKDGALAMRTLGNAIDASLVDLKGGTTGQVLSKNSNTDMDFTWVTSDDANAIQNSIVDAKGDLISASAADTPARLAVGNNGETLVADSSASTGLRWQGNYAAGKNKFINGDFNINQRGLDSIGTTGSGAYGFDRWQLSTGSSTTGSTTMSAQVFTPGSAPVAGYEAANYLRMVTTGQTTSDTLSIFRQAIEDVRTLAGRTITISFWAKAATGTPKIAVSVAQRFGSGGSPSASAEAPAGSVTISTSWSRYSITYAVPSISGKTIGTTPNTSDTRIQFFVSAGSDYAINSSSIGIQSNTFDIWGVQLEVGNVATAFQTATGTLAGELAACQRYYYRINGNNYANVITSGFASSTTRVLAQVWNPVELRTVATSVGGSTLALDDGVTTTAVTAIAIQSSTSGTRTTGFLLDVASGLTQYRPYRCLLNNNTAGYFEVSAEL